MSFASHSAHNTSSFSGPRLPLASTARKERPPGGGSRPSEIREQEEHDRPVAGPRTLLHLARVQRDDATSERPLELDPAVAHSRTGFGVRPEHDLDSTPSTTLGTADHEVQPYTARVETVQNRGQRPRELHHVHRHDSVR